SLVWIGILWLLVGGVAPARGSLEDGLVSYFRLDDRSGTTALDSSGNDHDGSPIGTDWTWVQGRDVGALRSRGTDRTARLEFPTAGMSAAQGTVCLWVYLANPQPSWTRYLFGHTSERQFSNRIELYMEGGATLLNVGLGDSHVVASNVVQLNLETWSHVALTWDKGVFFVYINGQPVRVGSYFGLTDIYPVANFANDGSSTPEEGFAGVLDEARIYNRAITAAEVRQMSRMPPSYLTKAKPTRPEDDAADVAHDVVLAWTPGEWAGAHDVYLGTVFSDVAAATRTDPRGVLVSQGRSAAEYDPCEPFDYGGVYYWRVDEINATADNTVYMGDVWTFTVEPYASEVLSVAVAASSAAPGMGPENIVNGSGLDGDRHSTDPACMWLSSQTGLQPTWIQFEFDAVYKLDEMRVWNFNSYMEPVIGFGVKDAIVAYSADEEVWVRLGRFVLEQAPAANTYTGQTIPFGGAAAKYVRLTIGDNWGGILPRYGLSEVRFYQIPTHARHPAPADDSRDAQIDGLLTWQSGREAVSQQVYFSDDPQSVADGTATLQTVVESQFDPGSLMLGTPYFWKVVEINEAATPPVWEGAVWTFTTREYLPVDDMESYNDDDHRIYNTWIDGVADDQSGSLVGYMESPFSERMIVHSGEQSMPFEYNNVDPPYYSQARRAFSPAQDWTVSGADTLALWIRGASPAYVDDGGLITMTGGGHDIGDASDDFRFACQTLNGDGSILVKVHSIEDTDPWAKAGVMIRESLDPESKFASMVVSPGGAVSMGWRSWQAGTAQTVVQADVAAPQWVRLTRAGNVFTTQFSADGATWTDLKTASGAVAAATVTMTNPALVGLCVTSHDSAAMTSAVMSDRVIAGAVGGSLEVAAIGDDAQPANDPADLYVTVEDKSGRTATAIHPTVVTSDEWTLWEIPFGSLTGVNVRAVERMSLRVGGKSSSSPGGRGRIYIDDIGFGHPAGDR
ncbi:MAG: LamG-like jellyroll fold domain-containing protein, partial [Solirubrobacterales bacterium]